MTSLDQRIEGRMFFFWLSYQTLLFMKTGTILSASRVIPLEKLCQVAVPTFYIRDSLVLYANHQQNFIADPASMNFTGRYRSDTRVYCKAKFDSLSDEIRGFLVNVENNLPTHQEHCSAWDVLFKLKSAKHVFKIGCTRFISSFFQKPMSLSFLPAALRQLINVYRRNNRSNKKSKFEFAFLDLFSVTITAVSYNCENPRNKFWVYCPGIDACIQPQGSYKNDLFCDGFNNCGLWEEERGCRSGTLELQKNQSSKASRNQIEKNQRTTTSAPVFEAPIPKPTKATPSFDFTEKGGASDPAVPTQPVDTAGISMVLGFFIFLGVCSFACCLLICWWQVKHWRSQNTFVDYVNQYNTISEGRMSSRRTRNQIPPESLQPPTERKSRKQSVIDLFLSVPSAALRRASKKSISSNGSVSSSPDHD